MMSDVLNRGTYGIPLVPLELREISTNKNFFELVTLWARLPTFWHYEVPSCVCLDCLDSLCYIVNITSRRYKLLAVTRLWLVKMSQGRGGVGVIYHNAGTIDAIYAE